MSGIIPFEHIEGDGETILFAHANGYPPLTYRHFFEALKGRYRIIAPYHRPLWPNSIPEDINSWNELAEDTLAFFAQRNISGVIGVGHSLGAVTNLFAAVQNPALFKALVLIDPVFLPPAGLMALRLAPGLARYNGIVKIARQRRNQWGDRKEAYDHFRQKKVFAGWSDEVLNDFIQYGLVENQEGVTLAYPREWEARVYSLPPQVWGAVTAIADAGLPTLGVRGEKTDAFPRSAWKTWHKKQPAAEFFEFPNTGHMIPMERPVELADRIEAFIKGLP